MGKAIVEPTGDKTCPECGKGFFVQYPSMWTYARTEGPRRKYFCSWSCMREYDKEKGEKKVGGHRKITKDQEKEDKEPEVSLADAMAGMQEAADMFFGACEDMGLKMETPEKPLPVQDLKLQPGGNYRISVETPEAPKICKPVIYDGMIIREVESLFGRLRRSDVQGSIYLDFEPTDFADVLSYTVDQWRSFFRDLKDCAAILGVEL